MADDSYLMVSLKDDQAKKIANVLGNDTSRKILDFLAAKESTETEIADALRLPLSTVHYNLKQLVASNLIVSDEYHYSKRGKEVNHYKVSNKFIVIAPAGVDRVKDVLKSLLPVGLVSAGVSGAIYFLQRRFAFAAPFFQKAVPSLREAAPAVEEAAVSSAGSLARDGSSAVPVSASPHLAAESVMRYPEMTIALWFLGGALFAILLFLLMELIRRRLDRR